MQNFYGAIAAFVTDAIVTVVVSYLGKPKPRSQLAGLVWGIRDPGAPDLREAFRPPRWHSPVLLGSGALAITLVLSLVFL